jgi:malonyl-CoA/methylmalonyl-CoA synthetase
MLADALGARWAPDAVALELGWGRDHAHGHSHWHVGTTWTYAELQRRVDQARGWLQARNLGPGDVLGVQLPRGLEQIQLVLGCMAEGVTVLPLNTAYTPREVRFYLQDAGAQRACLLDDVVDALISDPPCALEPAVTVSMTLAHAPAAAPSPTPPPDQGLFLFYTSGTTGRPKGALASHANIHAAVRALDQAWHWSRDDVLLHALPLFHVHGLVVALLGALWAGARTVLVQRFSAPEVLQGLQDHAATVFMGVPTFYHRLLSAPGDPDLSRLRLMTSGSAPLPVSVHQAVRARFGQTILERYGMSEVGIVLSNPYVGERRPGTVGFPLPGVSARVVDPETEEPAAVDQIGEIRIAGPSVFSGYLNLPDATAAALAGGEMHTGDLGSVSADGYFTIAGRASDMVLSGGLNVYPREIEAVLLEHPAVTQTAVVGVPDPDWGERVVGVVVLCSDADPAALIAHCRASLAGYKCPKELRVVEALPRNAMGKVQKARIRADWVSG